jgi:hypothetical protein
VCREHKFDPNLRQCGSDLAIADSTLVYLPQTLSPQRLHSRQSVLGFSETLMLYGGVLLRHAQQLKSNGVGLSEPL